MRQFAPQLGTIKIDDWDVMESQTQLCGRTSPAPKVTYPQIPVCLETQNCRDLHRAQLLEICFISRIRADK
jgi:hypothetical protein